jgi:ATP-dependent DNA helicase RecQ
MSRRRGRDSWEGLYGAVRICEVLCGRHKGPIREHGLERLSTFGLLAREGMDFTRGLLDECLRMGILRSSGGERPVVFLTAYGTSIMRGEAVPELVWPQANGDSPPRERKQRKDPSLLLESEDEPDEDLYEALKKRRLEIAQKRGVAAFTIFPNSTLQGLASMRPRTVEEAMAVPGIGKVKAERELPPFLEVIARWR